MVNISPDDWRQAALKALPRFVFDYVDGGSEDERCLANNRTQLDSIELTPRVLRDSTQVSPSTTLLGRGWAFPAAVGPTGLNGLVRPDGDLSVAKAAAGHGVPFVLSTASNVRLETIRQALPDANLWLQLYVMEDRGIAEQLLRRASAACFDALVLTVDVPVSGHRERDDRNGFSLPLKPTPGLAWGALTHPAWSLRQLLHGTPKFANLQEDPGIPMSAQAQAALLARNMDRSLQWSDLAWLRQRWQGPILLKGLLHPEDARRAQFEGIDGVIVSNHGGRQLDAAPAPVRQVPAIRSAVGPTFPLLVDGGVRRGTDIARCLSQGADAVLLGRAPLYALAAKGESGVKRVLSDLHQELVRTMTLMGARSVQEFEQG